MAFPFLSEANFEDGTKGHFDSETDTGSRLDIAHYSTLAKIPGLAMPWRGAYAVRVNLATSTNDAYLQEDTSWDVALDGALFLRLMVWVSPDIVMANNDEFTVLALQSTGPVNEVVLSLKYTTANGYRWGVGETAATSFLDATLGKWTCIEVSVGLDDGASNDGTIDFWVDGAAGTQVASLDQAAIIQGRIGVMSQDAGTTKGHILIDHVMADDGRLYFPTPTDRFPETVHLTASQHVFVGSGTLENITLASGGTDNTLEVYDTDTGNTNELGRRRVLLQTSTSGEVVDPAGMPMKLTRGCYVKLSGTASAAGPYALVKIGNAVGWGSDGAIRNYGFKRLPAPQNV